MLRRPKALIADDDEAIRDLLRSLLREEGFETTTAADGSSAIRKFESERPDIVLLDLDLPGQDGLEVCRRIRRDPRLSHVPIIAISGRADLFQKASTIRSGADDYITKPFDVEEVVARIQRILGRTIDALAANPLTLLPGNRAIEQAIDARLSGGEAFAVAYADLDNFKAYNDVYGWYDGDEIIKLAARSLVAAAARYAGENGFVGHIGGDDFVIVADAASVEELCGLAIALFEGSLAHYYKPEDWERGYITTVSRTGELQEFPPVSLSIAVAVSSGANYRHVAEFIQTAAEIKQYLKSKAGSNFLIDRRQ
jgi:diguanylate cyclase (GGDEF)-like protein